MRSKPRGSLARGAGADILPPRFYTVRAAGLRPLDCGRGLYRETDPPYK